MNTEPSILEISANVFDQQVLGSKRPVLVLFCGDTAPADRHLIDMVDKWAPSACEALGIIRVTGADARPLAARWGMPSIPSLALFDNGAVCYQFLGQLSRRELNEILARIRHRHGVPFALWERHPCAVTPLDRGQEHSSL